MKDVLLPHILHIIDSLAPGGSEKMAVEIANTTDPNKYRVSVCVTRNDLTLQRNLREHIRLLHLDRQQTFDWNSIKLLEKFCVQEKVDLFHVHGRYPFLFMTAVSFLSLAIGRIPTVLHDHFGDIEIDQSYPMIFRLALSIIPPYYVGVHNKLTELAVKSGLSPSRTKTIQNAIDFDAVKKNEAPVALLGFDAHVRPLGVMIANIRIAKDIEFLLRGLATIKHLDWTVAIIGDFVDADYAQECKTLHHELGLENRVVFLGKRLDIFHILFQADFALLTSRTESGPLVLIEYAIAGLPFVSTRVGMIGQLLASNGVQGFVTHGDLDGFSQALKDLLSLSSSQRKTRGMYGQAIAKGLFDLRVVMLKWYQVYESVLRS